MSSIIPRGGLAEIEGFSRSGGIDPRPPHSLFSTDAEHSKPQILDDHRRLERLALEVIHRAVQDLGLEFEYREGADTWQRRQLDTRLTSEGQRALGWFLYHRYDVAYWCKIGGLEIDALYETVAEGLAARGLEAAGRILQQMNACSREDL
jgi:hypothetical protein